MSHAPWRAFSLAVLLLAGLILLATCGGSTGNALYVQDVTENAQTYAGEEITVSGAYLWRPDPLVSVLAIGVSTLDSGLDAQPVGDTIWLEGFPPEVTSELHRPGDSVYGFVQVTGRLETGAFGPEGQYPLMLNVASAQPIEQVRYVEHTLPDLPAGEDVVPIAELQNNPEAYDEEQVTTRGFYFWNKIIWVLSERISTEEGGGSPQPLGEPIWMEGFPPELSGELNVGPNTSYVWGPIEVTGTFETGGGFGKDAAYESQLTAESVTVLEPTD
jgi:hypothetical protein